MSYIGNNATQQAFTPAIDYFSGNGSTTAFTLSRPVASVAQVRAVIENVPQNPNSAFTVSGNTITFTSAPPSGTNNIYVYYTSPITQVTQPSQGTVGPTQIANNYALWNLSGSDINYTAGNVGVGTASPAKRLHVVSTTLPQFRVDYNGTYYFDISNNGTFNITDPTSSNLYSFQRNGTEQMRIDVNGNVGIGTSSPNYKLEVSTAKNNTNLKLTSTGLNSVDDYTQLSFGDASNIYAAIRVGYNNPAGTTANYLAFYNNSGSSTIERARIDSSGNLLVGTTSVGYGSQSGVSFSPNGGNTYGSICHANGTASGNDYLSFGYNGNRIGAISQNGTTAVSYNTSSDYRLKHDIQPMTGALDKVALLKPCTYKWNADNSDGEGFIAHELQAVVPHAVTGEKDAVDADGNPQYQGIDTSFLVATLTAAIQEQQAIINALTERVAALENK